MRTKRPSAPKVLSIIAVLFSLAGTGWRYECARQ